jgi:hypothetical protein
MLKTRLGIPLVLLAAAGARTVDLQHSEEQVARSLHPSDGHSRTPSNRLLMLDQVAVASW